MFSFFQFIGRQLHQGIVLLIIGVMLFHSISSPVQAQENFESFLTLLFQDSFGDPLVSPLRLRISLWAGFDVRSGDILPSGAIDSLADNYGGYQTTVDILPLDRFFFEVRAGIFKLDLLSLSSFPETLDASNAFLQLEYKSPAAPDTDYLIYDFVVDDFSQDLLRLELFDVGGDTIPPDAGSQTVSDTFTIDDNDDASTAINLEFGSLLSEFLQWDIANDYFVLSDALVVDGNVNINGPTLRLNWDEAGNPDEDVEIHAVQGTEATGVIRYDDGNDRWEFSNDGVIFQPLGSGGGIPGLSDQQIVGADGELSEPMLFLVDTTRGNKLLTDDAVTFMWSENEVNKNDWIEIGNAKDNDSGYIMPYDGTVVRVTAHTEDAHNDDKDILLYIEGVSQGPIANLSGSGEDSFVDTDLDIDFDAGNKFRLRGDSSNDEIKDTVVTLWVKWRIGEGSGGPGDPDPDQELAEGHFDVDTSSFISDIDDGDTDGHVHEYDKKYDTSGIDAFDLINNKLHNITEDISDGDQKFKLIVANADLSSGGRLSINQSYNNNDSGTWTDVDVYDDTVLSSLPIYSLNGVAGSTQLSEFSLFFDVNVVSNNEIHGTETSCVRDNELGPNDEWRNGALTIQAVKVDAAGNDDFSTNLSYSAGGVQGVADSGLLWETTLFYHWNNGCFGDDDDDDDDD